MRPNKEEAGVFLQAREIRDTYDLLRMYGHMVVDTIAPSLFDRLQVKVQQPTPIFKKGPSEFGMNQIESQAIKLFLDKLNTRDPAPSSVKDRYVIKELLTGFEDHFKP